MAAENITTMEKQDVPQNLHSNSCWHDNTANQKIYRSLDHSGTYLVISFIFRGGGGGCGPTPYVGAVRRSLLWT